MKDHCSRIMRHSSRRHWHQFRIKGPPKWVQHYSLLRFSTINVIQYLLLTSVHGKIKILSTRLFQDRIQETQGEIWFYFSIFPLWNQVGIQVYEYEESWRPRVVYQHSGETISNNERRLRHEYFGWRHHYQGLKQINKRIRRTSRLYSSSDKYWKSCNYW